MSDFQEGDVVICGTGQSGTLVQEGSNVWILLRNGDLWTGPENRIRHPQDEADLEACPMEVERFVDKNIIQR
jgi:hypothetical protein